MSIPVIITNNLLESVINDVSEESDIEIVSSMNSNFISFVAAKDFNNVNLIIYDLLGRAIRSKKYGRILSNNKISISISNLPKGIYFLYFQLDKSHEVFKFVN